MLKRIKLEVQRSELSVTVISVPQWEVPIVIAMFGPNAVKTVGEELVNRDPPDPNVEFDRLTRRYGRTETEDGGKGPSYADAVFGQFGVGAANLKREIDKAIVEVADTPDSSVEDLI